MRSSPVSHSMLYMIPRDWLCSFQRGCSKMHYQGLFGFQVMVIAKFMDRIVLK